MKILLVVNKPNRDMGPLLKIKAEILAINPDVKVEIKEMFNHVFSLNKYFFKFKPNVIFTIPFTVEGGARWFYIYKFLYGCKIICFRAEGVIDLRSELNIEWAVGMDRYGSRLVDYEIFWGKKLANVVGQKLFETGKLSSIDRIKVAGYPRLEHYFSSSDEERLPKEIKNHIDKYNKNKIALFITGFHLANYTRKNLIEAKDLVNSLDQQFEEKLFRLEQTVLAARKFREIWIKNVIQAAVNNPDVLIISKKHPIEKDEDYNSLSGIDNILFVNQDFEIDALVKRVGILFHYGSTAVADSYLCKVPSIYVFSEECAYYSNLGWPSTQTINVNQINSTVYRFSQYGIPFSPTDDIDSVLYDMFNIDLNCESNYQPSREIAQIILGDQEYQKIKIWDFYLWQAFVNICYKKLSKLFFNK